HGPLVVGDQVDAPLLDPEGRVALVQQLGPLDRSGHSHTPCPAHHSLPSITPADTRSTPPGRAGAPPGPTGRRNWPRWPAGPAGGHRTGPAAAGLVSLSRGT